MKLQVLRPVSLRRGVGWSVLLQILIHEKFLPIFSTNKKSVLFHLRFSKKSSKKHVIFKKFQGLLFPTRLSQECEFLPVLTG